MIELKDVFKTYSKGKENAVKALNGVSLKIDDGELVAIIGKSGSGKTTLLNMIACIDSFDKGTYLLNGKNITKNSEKKLSEIRNKEIGIVIQDFALISDETVIENVMLPFYFDRRTSLKKARGKALTVLKEVGIGELAKKPVNKLSGGQKQRVAIARAIVNHPSIILADEPTGALDTKTAAEIMDVFHDLNEKGHTVIIVTHDPQIAEQCGRVIEISDGRIVKL